MTIFASIGQGERRTVWPVAAAVFCIAAWGSVPARAANTPQCAVLTHTDAADLFDRWHAALAGSDVMQLVGLYSDRAELAADVEDVPHRGRQAILTYYESLLRRHPQASVASRTIETGCNVATESGRILYRVTGKRKGTRMLLGGQYQTRYRFEAGAWRIDRHLLGARSIPARAPI